MYAFDFEYDGRCLSEFGFIICNIGSSSDTDNTTAGSNITFNKVARYNGKRHSLIGTTYSECISCSFDICKDPDKYDENKMEISEYEFRDIMRWLNRREFLPFRVFYCNASDGESCYYHASFNLEKVMVGDRLYGIRLTMETDSPFGYGSPQELTWEIDNNSIVFTDISDEIGYIQPTLTIVCGASGDLKLYNSQFDTPMVIENCTNGEIITVDGENQILKSSVIGHNVLDDFNYYFFKIGNTYDDRINTISASIPVTVSMSYVPIIKNGL